MAYLRGLKYHGRNGDPCAGSEYLGGLCSSADSPRVLSMGWESTEETGAHFNRVPYVSIHTPGYPSTGLASKKKK
jgi:hypothetical protein